ncbi:MAG: stalk domain-containing protein [Tissierellaceae bacterium]|nr:stalk domain-containing protein [Tissierellaceae bacterium]
MTKFKLKKNGLYTVLIAVLLFSQTFSSFSYGISPIKLVVDGKEITSDPKPVIENDRTLVPIRFVLEQLGAEFDWAPKDSTVETVTITKGDISVNLRIDSQLVTYDKDGKNHIITDVAPKIIDDRTFVPIRLISNIFGLDIDWDNDTRSVIIDSSIPASIEPFYPMEISSIKNGQTISGKTKLSIDLGDSNLRNPKVIKYLLLDPETSVGKVIAQGSDLNGEYTWLPSVDDMGHKALVAAIYDANGKIISADAVPVNMQVKPSVKLNGISNSDVIDNRLTVNPDVNFVANYIEYTITNLDNGTVIVPAEKDPYGSYTWTPQVKDNGNYSIKVIAYDKNGNSYESESFEFKIDVSHKISLTGVSSGMTIDKPVTLDASRNFGVDETEYILRDPNTGKEEILKTLPYGGYKWFPGPGYKGEKELLVRVKYMGSKVLESKAVKVNIPGTPNILLQGIGPNEVITGDKTINVISNVDLTNVNYVLTNTKDGSKKVFTLNANEDFVYSPKKEDSGYLKIYAEGINNGKTIKTEEIPFRVYLEQIYGKQPVIEKDKFLGVASRLARESFLKTGLSAAIQTSQSILETGWGQFVGVDKYTGQISYNLFGIKGKGPAGSVTIRTTEVYNGVRYSVDDNFRAYNSIDESWVDYNAFLLERERYQPVRDVMYNSTQAAWAIRRSGYATDPNYSLSLIRIIEQYNLDELDKIDI